MKNIEKKAVISHKLEFVASIMLVAIVVIPALSFAANKEKLFVDADASGTQDGSAEHPYKTINEAIKHADDDTEIHVGAGKYKENIQIPEGVKIFGSERSKVVIEADDDDDAVVRMKDDTEINKVTIRNGRVGVEVGKDDEASIINCIIEENDDDGVYVKRGDTSKKDPVSITDSLIRNNGKAGIYAQKRRLVIMDNEIIDNDRDGIVLEAGSSAWIEDNDIKENEKSGMRLVLDGSNIWTKSNTYRDNGREGIEINAFGGAGRIDVAKSKFIKNERYGIARVIRKAANAATFKGVTFDSRNDFWGNSNKIGTISSVIRVK